MGWDAWPLSATRLNDLWPLPCFLLLQVLLILSLLQTMLLQ